MAGRQLSTDIPQFTIILQGVRCAREGQVLPGYFLEPVQFHVLGFVPCNEIPCQILRHIDDYDDRPSGIGIDPKKILDTGFDGVYLDIIDAYEYFE